MKNNLISTILDIAAFLAIFFAEIQGALLAIGFLIMSDTITGVWASWKVNGRKSVTSRKMGRVVTKLILYPLAIIVAKVAEEYLSPLIPWTEVTMGILAVVEVKSVFENISGILGFDLWDRIKKAIWKDKDDARDEDK
jgi:phage-related holin